MRGQKWDKELRRPAGIPERIQLSDRSTSFKPAASQRRAAGDRQPAKAGSDIDTVKHSGRVRQERIAGRIQAIFKECLRLMQRSDSTAKAYPRHRIHRHKRHDRAIRSSGQAAVQTDTGVELTNNTHI